MFSDFRFALRQLAKSPGFAATVIVTLALGIGACTAMFSIVNAFLMRPLPFPDSERLVQIWDRSKGPAIYPEALAYKYWRAESTLLERISISDPIYRTLSSGPLPEQIKGLSVSANYLKLFGIQPLLGHDFSPDAEQPGGANSVTLLSYEMWQTRFGGDPGIIDRTIMLHSVPHTVVGVLAPNALPRSDVLFLTPLVHTPDRLRARRTTQWAIVTARLKPGVTPAEAEAETTAIMRAHAGEFGPTSGPLTTSVVTLREQLVGAARPTMLMLLGAGVLVLLIACANATNLLLVRATARTKEMAVRSALGAGPRRIMRQVLMENLLLATLGGGLAMLTASLVVDQLGDVVMAVDPALVQTGAAVNRALTGGELPAMLQPRVDWAVLSFAFAMAVVTGVGCGAFPAWRACRSDVNRDLQDAGRGTTSGGRTRTQSMFVALEIGVAVVLLIGAGLFLRSFARIVSVDPGFNPANVYAFDLSLPGATYKDGTQRARFTQEVVRRLRELPEIEAASATTDAPFGSRGLGGGIGLAEETDRSRDVSSGHNYVETDFFNTLGLRLRQGRWLTAADNNPAAPRTMVISESLARTLFGEQNPIGRALAYDGNNWEVVGVAGDWQFRSLETGHGRFFFAPFVFSPGRASVVVRSLLPPRTVHDAIRKNVRGLDPEQPVAIRTLTDGVGQSLRGRQAVLVLVNVFAGVALVLACLGISGVMAYTIAQRQRELGIRMALGASQPNVIALVLRDGLRLALIGLGAGLLGALAGAQLIESLLFGVSARDPIVFTAATIALAVIAGVACWLPARRATKVDPMIALRAE